MGATIFNHYVYERREQVMTDHQPLETILIKPFPKASPRIQYLMMYIQLYNLTFKYRAGTVIPVADALSKLHLPNVDENKYLYEEIQIFVYSSVKALPAKDSRLEEIRQKIAIDQELKVLRKIV